MKANLLISISLVLYAWHINSQGLVKTLQPNTYSYLQGSQQMPDSSARFFLISLDSKFGSSGQVFMVDQLTQDSFEIDGLLDTVDGTPLGDGIEIIPLFIEDGNAILLVNSFQCDILFSDVVFVNQNGVVEWRINYEAFTGHDLMQIDRVGKDIFVVTDENEKHYFDFEGQEVFFPPSETPYHNIFYYAGYYYGNRENRVYKLDDDFDVVDSYQVDSVIFFQHLGQDLFFIGSKDGIEIVTNTFDVIVSNPAISGISSVSYNNEYVWVITAEGLQVLDPELQPSDFHPNEINEDMKYTWVYQDTTYVASEYTSLNHVDLVIRKYTPDQFIIGPVAEAEISSLFFPDTVIRKYWYDFPYAFLFSFKSMGVEVTNRSEDTLRSCVINCDWSSDVWCVYYVNEWKIDTIAIPPHGSTVIELGAFETNIMYYAAGPPFCFWVDVPNGHPDIFPSNDMLCGEALILSSGDVKAGIEAFEIYPNPATESLTLSIGSLKAGFHKVSIFNNLGQIVGEHQIPEPSQSIPVHELSPGIYYLFITDEKLTETGYSLFIKQ